MPALAPVPDAELLRSLGRLVRGLSALFWGLPLALLICVRTAMSEWLKPVGMFPPIIACALLYYGLWQLGHFHRQERIWTHALERAKVLGIVNIGLSPFIYWWNKLPHIPFYSSALVLLAVSGLLFIFNLNQALQRLAAMLPDETLRLETRWFTSVNFGLLFGIFAAAAVFLALRELRFLPSPVERSLALIQLVQTPLILLLTLLPLALTMILLWKMKEVILESVFAPHSPDHVPVTMRSLRSTNEP